MRSLAETDWSIVVGSKESEGRTKLQEAGALRAEIKRGLSCGWRVLAPSSSSVLSVIGGFFFALTPAFRTQCPDPSESEGSRGRQAALPTLLTLMLRGEAFPPRPIPAARPGASGLWSCPTRQPQEGPGAQSAGLTVI